MYPNRCIHSILSLFDKTSCTWILVGGTFVREAKNSGDIGNSIQFRMYICTIGLVEGGAMELGSSRSGALAKRIVGSGDENPGRECTKNICFA